MLVLNDMLVKEIFGAIADAASEAQPRGKEIFVIAIDEWIPIRGLEPRFVQAVAA